MSITRDELTSFHDFAAEKLNNGGAGLSLEDCLDLWRLQQDADASTASIRRGLTQADNGETRRLADADSQIRSDLGFQPHP